MSIPNVMCLSTERISTQMGNCVDARRMRVYIERRGTKRAQSAHGKRTQDDLVAAPGDVHLNHCRTSCVKAMKNLLDGTGDQLPALSHVNKPQVATGNQTEDTQHILACDTGGEGNSMHHWQGLV